jgi:hypothetical protein
MGLIDVLFEQLLRLIIYLFRSVVLWIKQAGTGSWACSEATVIAEPSVSRGFWRPTVEVVYSYRIEGELHTGLHEEPFLSADSLKEYVARFSNGRKFVVRFNAVKPDHSVIRQQDQVMELAHS